MNIVITHDQYQKKGGVERYLFDLIRGFIDAGDTVTLLVYKIDTRLPVPDGCTLHKLPANYFPRTIRRLVLSMMANRYLKRVRYDLSISLSYAAHHDIVLAGNACLKKGHRRKWWFKQWVKNAYELHAMKTCRYVMTHAKQVQIEIAHHHPFLKNKLRCWYPPINTNIFSQVFRKERAHYRQALGLSPEHYVLLFPSTGHKRKGWSLLLEAMKQLPQERFQLLVAGDPPQTPLQDLPHIHYCGFVDSMATLYVAADITVLPSYHEPFGLVVIESIACGTPVLISNYVGARELLSQEQGRILMQMTPTALAQQLLETSHTLFSISPHFVLTQGLTVSQHIQSLKEVLVD